MGDVVALPLTGLAGSASLPDTRGEHRALQVTWHDEDAVVVVSTWRFGRCVATVRLAPDDAAALIATLAQGLARCSTAPSAPAASLATGQTAVVHLAEEPPPGGTEHDEGASEVSHPSVVSDAPSEVSQVPRPPSGSLQTDEPDDD